MINSALLVPVESALERGLKIAFICVLHLLLLAALVQAGFKPQMAEELFNLNVRVIEDKPPVKVEPERPRPLPATPRSVAATPAEPPPPAPLMTAAAEAPALPATFTVPPQPAARPEPPPAASPAPSAPAASPPVTAARFDADYLHNPAPAYPLVSRRVGDQGRVLLRVLVNTQGTASVVQIQASSGHTRLDEAASETVRQWRFVPARRGTEAIEGWVLVPIDFRLDR